MNLFNYSNYRHYLKDYYDYRKSINRYFSYRAFAQKAGYVSSGFYLDVVKGRKSLTPQMASKFIKALGLNNKETRYFSLMIDFTHAEAPDLKQKILDQMAQLLPHTGKILARTQQEYYSKWYYVAVREALSILDISENYQELSHFLSPHISVPQVKQSIQLLYRLGLIEKINGYWRAVNRTLSSGSEIQRLQIRRFQKQMIEMSSLALDDIKADRRNISCTTMSISQKGFERIARKIDAFRKEIIDIVTSDEKESMVYEFNIQFFPLSKEKEFL